MRATVSIMGLMQSDSTILNPLLNALPSPDLFDAVKYGILDECGELEIRITNPTIFKIMLAGWCVFQKSIWRQLYDTLFYEYNPIHNYDRVETETVDRKRNEMSSGKQMATNKNKIDSSGKDASMTTEEKRYGLNYTAGSVPTGEVVETPGTYNSSTSSNSANNLDTNNKRDEDENTDRTLRAYGNIGVTTTQQMIDEQRRVVQFNVVRHIVDDFKKQYCLLVY